jgi:hypothetical protein
MPLLSFLRGVGKLAFDYGLQTVMIIFTKRGEFKRLPVPRHWRQHLGFANNGALVGKEHQFPNCAWLYWPLQTQQAAGYRNNLELRGASDATREPYYHRGFLFESDTLRPFVKFSLGGVGHECSISVLFEN